MLDSILGTGDVAANKIKIAAINNSLHFLVFSIIRLYLY